MAEFLTDNGKKIVINPASFENAINLKNAIQRAAASAEFEFDFDMSKDLAEQDFSIGEIVKTVLTVDSDMAVNACLFECLKVCTYDSEKITKITFDDVEARSDYYRIVIECVKENLLPFFGSLVSKYKPTIDALATVAAIQGENQKSK